MFVPQILFQLKNGERFFRIVEHGSNRRAGTMTGNVPPAILFGNTCFLYSAAIVHPDPSKQGNCANA